ncbi:MAG: hypothetical protein M3179_01185 [Actinomycetota bacterium]|nr:hypothetical protein [Actinomycetota bacterium]
MTGGMVEIVELLVDVVLAPVVDVEVEVEGGARLGGRGARGRRGVEACR